ncbi:RNA-directed DNA polymerase [Paraflavitalea speifideaquila]|uniref:RNA-directed DNA polymerase n=1 Tax=Paraflavitalea speifideaquila TaxID=3076558 RepID=UPI0028EEF02C|nr:reverse transcriptase domain-containing protein [Paraflavitalea speifideiaquila]
MKRVGNVYQRICSIENLEAADMIARKGKKDQYGIKVHDRNREANILALHHSLLDKTFKTSAYTTFFVYEPKEREVFQLPYYPDRIVHHAVMNVMGPIFVSTFTADTYSCIKGRGIHAAAKAVKRALADEQGTMYCLKFDIRKFYPNVDHRILKQLLRRKIKDQDLLWLLDEIIDSAPGLPIGNYLSQYFANYYLTFFDHWVKEVLKVKYYFRYADDIVILASSKEYLHGLLIKLADYLADQLCLAVKGNYQVFPVSARGIDFVGYIFYHTHTRLRESIKKRFARMMARNPNMRSFASYYGWACHADCRHLLKTLTNDKIFRPGHNHRKKGLYRGQNQNRLDIEPPDFNTRL